MRLAALALTAMLLIPANSIPSSSHPPLHDSVAPVSVLVPDMDADAADPTTPHLRHSHICTAVSINQRRHVWLTAAHCIIDGDKVASTPRFVQHKPATVLRVDGAADLALLVGEAGAPAPAVHTTPSGWLDPVRLVGVPLGMVDFVVTAGTIANPRMVDPHLRKPYTLFAISLCRGHSGSPVFDRYDRLISIIQYGFGEGACAPLAGGATADQLQRFLVGVID